MPAIPALTATLGDGHVELRLAEERDIPEVLIAFQDDPELHLRLGLDRPPSGAQLGSQAEEAQARREGGRGVELTILEPGSDVCRGRVNVHRIDWKHRRAELGLWLVPQARGRGWAPRALHLAARWLLSDCGIDRVEVQTEPDNDAMVHTAVRAGFVREGVLRSYLLERGGRVDVVMFSLIPSDPPPEGTETQP
jgi:[ribosomal protein S5]-alanine N-acetyltransferase